MSSLEHVLMNGKNMLNRISNFFELEQSNFSSELQDSILELEQKLNKEGTYVLYRQVNDVIEDFIIFTEKDEDALEHGIYLDVFVVKEKGKGFGKKMEQVLCTILINMGYTSISLRTEEIPTKEGIELVKWYSKLGYQIVGKDEKGVLMRKFLTTENKISPNQTTETT